MVRQGRRMSPIMKLRFIRLAFYLGIVTPVLFIPVIGGGAAAALAFATFWLTAVGYWRLRCCRCGYHVFRHLVVPTGKFSLGLAPTHCDNCGADLRMC